MQHQHSQPPVQSAGNLISSPPESQGSTTDAPPKQVALAMDRLAHAARLIADIRLGADRLLEALFIAGQQPHQSSSNKPLHLIIQEGASMRQYLQDLRTIGRQLEDSGVLNESLRSRSNSWGLHMPLVCPDGAVVAYAWKRQLAGQAGASAVDRTRLALKAFTDQKRRFFPHLDEDSGNEPVSKKHRGNQTPTVSQQEEFSDLRTVSDVLTELEKEVPEVKTSTYQRLDWLKRASLLPSSSSETLDESSKDHNFHSSRDIRPGSGGAVVGDQIAVIELLIPSVFRAVISLHPTGSLDPDAVAFFSPDEGGSYVHARGVSAFNTFRNITEHAAMAPHHFIGVNPETALCSLLRWICSYQTLFTKVCSKCGKLLSMDKESALLLPPVQRPYRNLHSSSKDESIHVHDIPAYHIGCFPQDA
ncbi:mediator of RNA polymerase II transcription subunit 27 [Cynara cardunculus var. scolymus]|uniref:mediator of RNA polymerase II transcription subunit 27 n=1 Tax=Cynara cardunculus var. scolymus TaxID=59895 RepID=UPI000D623FE0|nr:mediator of RNA polymerase II transcription subunit 27 [Cynara cardunculus var. scolymus]